MESLDALKREIKEKGIDAREGLPYDLFLFSTTLSPVVNVDLLIVNSKKQILLTWREDEHNGSGWHIPGGCIRFKETIDSRIRNCALDEIGLEVEYNPEVIAVIQHIIDGERNISDQNERAHFITLLYKCMLKSTICENDKMKWFDDLPDNLLKTQNAYREHWSTIKNKV